jgi:hypothetical protein
MWELLAGRFFTKSTTFWNARACNPYSLHLVRYFPAILFSVENGGNTFL